MQKIQRLFIIALFGSIIFVTNVFLPPPLNYLIIVVQAVLLALSSLFIPRVGAMYVGAVGGILTALVSPALGPFTFFFAFLFGVFVDVFLFVFKINASTQGVNRNRLIAAMALSTFTHCSFKLFRIRAYSLSILIRRGFRLLVCLFKGVKCSMFLCCLWVQPQVQWLVMLHRTYGISIFDTSTSK